jgi:hypothetical protein
MKNSGLSPIFTYIPIILIINVKKLPFHNNFYENREYNNRI